MIGAHWCQPIGWTPGNEIPGSEFKDGSWRDQSRETAGIIYFTPMDDGVEVEVPLGDLRVATCDEWHIIGEVIVRPESV
jgi:hypothetical protein